MERMWNEKFAQEEYIYGEEPNEYFKEELKKLNPGKILLPAEGEGRNAVFAAKNGWKVLAFDSSIEGKKKAEKLAAKNQQRIFYQIADMENFDTEENQYDVIALIYAHSTSRERNHKNIIRFLKPGGYLILEGFSKKQINNNTGGPKKESMLFSKKELAKDFSSLTDLKITEEEIILNEGAHHQGNSSVIRLIGRK